MTSTSPAVGAYRRMWLIATGLLMAMVLIFTLTTTFNFDQPWQPYLRAFAEAGMVGACADWFAVVALFRHPLGVPIPHTAIVPTNKERIGRALGVFITKNFLTAREMRSKLSRVDIVGPVGKWLSEPANAKRVGHFVAVVLLKAVTILPPQQIGETFGAFLQRTLQAVPAAPLASKLLNIVWAHGEMQNLIAQVIEYGEHVLSANKSYVSEKISRHSWRWVPKWIDKVIVDKVLDGLHSTLAEMRDPNHPWRLELKNVVERLIVDLANDPRIQLRVETWKAEFLASPLLKEQAQILWSEIEQNLDARAPAYAESIALASEHTLSKIGCWLQEDSNRKDRLNRRIRVMTQRFLLSFRFEFAAYIERVVREWDSTTLVQRLELQVGKDLQYIRINGTLIGGLVGLLIFTASKWLAGI